jgi:hypothetical protein
MNNEEIKNLIQLFHDNELDKGRETVLFSVLSANEEAREYFKELNLLKTGVSAAASDFPELLEKRIFTSVQNIPAKRTAGFKRNIYLSAASLSIAVLMLFVSLFLFFEMRDYRSRIDTVSEQVRIQNRTIEMILYNSLPPAEVETKKVNEIIIRANL